MVVDGRELGVQGECDLIKKIDNLQLHLTREPRLGMMDALGMAGAVIQYLRFNRHDFYDAVLNKINYMKMIGI